MRSPAVAIAWELYSRHRWGLWAVAAYLVAVILFGTVEYTESNSARLAWTLIVPLTLAYFFLLATFSLGLAGDVAARASMYPPRGFTLPVSNAALAGWPMLYGVVTVAVLWLLTAVLAPWPASVYIPLVWPALYLAVFLAWTQVLLWLPYPLQGLRIVAALLWMTVFGVSGQIAIHAQPPEWTVVALLAPQFPIVFLLARYAVGRARCNEVPDWRGVLALPAWLVIRSPDRPFASAFRAQVRYEWGQYGWSLPLWTAILLPVALSLLFLTESPTFVLLVVLVALLTPPVMASFVAASVHRAESPGRDGQGMATLQATRPMTSAALVGAKLTATAASTLLAWLLVAVAVPAALLASDTWPLVAALVRRVSDAFGTGRAVLLAVLLGSALLATNWKLLVQSLYVGLSGRAWLIRLYVALALAALVCVVPLYFWLQESAALEAFLWSAAPWRAALAVLVALKMAAISWAVIRLQRADLLDGRTLLRGAMLWTVAVFALYGAFVWLLDTPQLPGDIVMAIAILAVPLGRLAAAPLALDWNRHRW